MFFINHAPKFTYKSSCLKVKACDNQNRTVQVGTVRHKMSGKKLPINEEANTVRRQRLLCDSIGLCNGI
jgi:hypothetical protein